MSDIVPLYDAHAAASNNYPYVPPQAPERQAVDPRQPIVFNPPTFAVTHPIPSGSVYESMMTALGGFCGAFGQIPGCFCCPNPFKVVRQGEIALVARFGRYYKTADPGLVKVNPLTEKIRP
ncbi:hypothetical protein EV174_005340, partial [Coemansia sp. RSA 2320]